MIWATSAGAPAGCENGTTAIGCAATAPEDTVMSRSARASGLASATTSRKRVLRRAFMVGISSERTGR